LRANINRGENKMSRILFQNAYVITMNQLRQAYEMADILIENDRIVEVGKVSLENPTADVEIIDCSGKMIIPGLVNTHVHLSQQLGRGLADDVDLLTWLRKRTWPYESSMSEEEQYLSAIACCIELIKSGVTSFAEAGGFHVDSLGKAVEQMGIRCALARSTMDAGEGLPNNWVESTEYALNKQIDAFEKWNNKGDGRIKYWFAVRTIFNATEELLMRTKEIAKKFNTGIHMHIAEIPEEVDFVKKRTGYSPVEYLSKIGFLGENLLAAHTVWLTDREVDLFRLHDVKVSHNPGAAMRVLGFAKIPEMIAKGLVVSIGTDGAPCNNRMDMIDEMHLTALIHKGRTLDPKVVPAETILEMATINGAKAIQQEDETGSIEVGKKADLIIINPKSIGSLPLHDPVSNLVYAMHSSNVESSMCNGKWVMKDRKILVIDEDEIIKEVEKTANNIRKKAGIQLPDRFPTVRG
jgi:5-methylthioadenosine/S-adenosylhomocysteine deaminase